MQPFPPPHNPAAYFTQRMDELGITEEENAVVVAFDWLDDAAPRTVPIFSAHASGDIEIRYVGLNGHHTYFAGSREKPYIRFRRHPDRVGEGPKYLTPRGAGAQLFIPPLVLTSYRDKVSQKTLVVTEGEFKAFKAAKHGLFCVGLQGIHNFTEKDDSGSNVLNTELVALIETCGVKNVVLLFDSDCREVAYEKGKDLAKRPNSFYSAVRNFRELTKPLNCDVYFAHVKPDAIVKGLDDLLVKYPEKEKAIVSDLTRFKSGSNWFEVQNVSENSLGKLLDYFHLRNSETFYGAYREVLEENPFVFQGNVYQHDGKMLKLVVSGEIRNFIRVGDQYFEHIQKPDKYGALKPALESRNKATIIDDYGPKAIQHVPKYKAFVNVPDHLHYRPVISECYNSYRPLSHQPEPGEVPFFILGALRHLFGEKHLDFALDYLQLLYLRPTQRLPIICLVSEQTKTGKSTFGTLLKLIFEQNAVEIGNADLSSDFNSTYADKLVVVVDEATIEKQVVMEAVKRMSTTDGKIWVNAKNTKQYEIDFFGKFVFISNHEVDFLRINRTETRFAVFKVPKLEREDPHAAAKMAAEIPALLDFLSRRTLAHPEASRMYFDFEVYRTEWLAKVMEAGRPLAEKAIRGFLEDAFAQFSTEHELCYTFGDLVAELKKEYSFLDTSKIKAAVNDRLGLSARGKAGRYKYWSVSRNQMSRLSEPEEKIGKYVTFFRADFASEDEDLPEKQPIEAPPEGVEVPF